MSIAALIPWYKINTLKKGAEIIKHVIESLDYNGFNAAQIISMVFEFVEENGVYGACEDCERTDLSDGPSWDWSELD